MNCDLQEETPHWYAVSIFARQEKAAAKEIKNLGVDVFLPMTSERRLWSDRVKSVPIALFPGYLFVNIRFEAALRFAILRAKQVIDLVGMSRREGQLYIHAVPDMQIESLKTLVNSGQPLISHNQLMVGAEVMVMRGPFKGVIGIIQKSSDKHQKLVVQIPLLGRSVSVDVEEDDLYPKELIRVHV